ncbi:MAG: AAA family ATPase, partial [Ignavibacteria bacterium]|nr:AAA family ATPase [Ignavibacteria bacterium]
QFGMAHYLDVRSGRYSRGMKQTLGIVTALMHEPELILLDEPTTGLDPVVIRILRGYIRQIHNEGRSVIISSHQLSELELLSDRVALVDGGVLKAMGRLSNLAAAGKRIRVTTGIKSPDRLGGKPDGWSVSVEGGMVVLSSASPVALGPLLNLLESRDIDVVDIETRDSTLEDIFFKYSSE